VPTDALSSTTGDRGRDEQVPGQGEEADGEEDSTINQGTSDHLIYPSNGGIGEIDSAEDSIDGMGGIKFTDEEDWGYFGSFLVPGCLRGFETPSGKEIYANEDVHKVHHLTLLSSATSLWPGPHWQLA
jgi:hypothetical protein